MQPSTEKLIYGVPMLLIMVHVEEETKNGIIYLRVSHRARINGKSTRIWSIWLGRKDKIHERVQDIKNIFEQKFEPILYDYGLPVVLMKIAERLDLINIIDECTAKRGQGLTVGQYIMIATLQRCIKPESKVHIKNWFHSTYLQHMFPEIETYLDSMAYTNHYPYLTEESIEKIEIKIAEKLRTMFQVEMKELFFDPTNLFTFTNPRRENQTVFGHGHSKEGRHALNLVNLSLICTRDGGVPVMHCTYPGGTPDAVHFKDQYPKILRRLNKLKISALTVILVFDKGNISPVVFKAIDDSKIYWVCSVRPSVHKDLAYLTSDDFPMFELPNKKKVGVLEMKRPMFSEAAIKKSEVPEYKNPDRRLIIQYNPERARWNGKNLIHKLQARIDEINKYFKGSKQRLVNTKRFPKWKTKSAVETKIKNTITRKNKEKYLDYIIYKVTSTRDPVEGVTRVQYELGINQEELEKYLKTLGKSYHMTNHPTMTALKLIWLYRQQFNVEQAFRYLKSPDAIRIRPIHVHTDTSVQGHNFTCVLGLLLLTLIAREVKESFPELAFPTIRGLLAEIKAIAIEFPRSHRKIQKIIKLSPEAKKLSDFYKLNDLLL